MQSTATVSVIKAEGSHSLSVVAKATSAVDVTRLRTTRKHIRAKAGDKSKQREITPLCPPHVQQLNQHVAETVKIAMVAYILLVPYTI